MAMQEPPADLLRRAADRLVLLDKAAIPGPWWQETDRDEDGHPFTTGLLLADSTTDQIARGADDAREFGDLRAMDGALVVALRPAAAPLADWLRSTADRTDSGNGIPIGRGIWLEPALATARAVLGETGG